MNFSIWYKENAIFSPNERATPKHSIKFNTQNEDQFIENASVLYFLIIHDEHLKFTS